MKKFREWISLRVAKTPGAVVLVGIILINIVLFCVSALVISHLAPPSLEHRDFWSSIFYTISMVLDAGCVQYVIADVGEAGALLIVVCLTIVLLGMVVFTGAVIGYVSNWIAGFIDRANAGDSKLLLSGHTVIINWNTRGSEIINDFMYKETREVVVVLVPTDKTVVEKEIADRLSDTLALEKRNGTPIKNRLTVIVREGDTYSTKSLNDIGLSQAKSVILLDNAGRRTVCKYEQDERMDRIGLGNANTVKTLVQVAEITAAQQSADDQQIIVEVGDAWTLSVIEKIIAHKMRKGKCNIVPVSVYLVLGQILSQFSLTPELNIVYSTLFSNKGAAFYCTGMPEGEALPEESAFLTEVLKKNSCALPLTVMTVDGCGERYFMADSEHELAARTEPVHTDYRVSLNESFSMGIKNVVILGHNSKIDSIMEGFRAFCGEWKDAVLNILVMDDKKNLERHDYYRRYPFVRECINAEVFDRELIFDTINRFIDENEEDTSILILSDDTCTDEDMDAAALTYLINIQDIVKQRKDADPSFDVESVDIVVEILNPKNYDVVHNYSVNNIVISNRYISKMMAQVSEKKALFSFYNDILSYDAEDSAHYESKELYIKPVSKFFSELPAPATAADLVHAVYVESCRIGNPSVLLGYVQPGGKMVLFSGDRNEMTVALGPKDKLVLFSGH